MATHVIVKRPGAMHVDVALAWRMTQSPTWLCWSQYGPLDDQRFPGLGNVRPAVFFMGQTGSVRERERASPPSGTLTMADH
jgi:hypothetical protein